MSVQRAALVIGKFLPPHAGHHHVIDHALEAFGDVDVIVCDLPGQRPTAEERRRWLAEIHPGARVSVVPDICGWHGGRACPLSCSSNWADHLRDIGFTPWRAVVGSEPYVLPFAAALGAEPVLVDPDRLAQPVSGTALREDLAASWGYLHPVVRAGLTRRVVVLGAESTGTTTLARDLAARLGVPWVPEYGREYSAHLARAQGSIWDVTWESAHFDEIADRQPELEEEVTRSWVANADQSRPGELGPLIVCDTDLLATAVWHKRYCGDLRDDLIERACDRPALVYVLTTPEGVPFEQDGLRDGEHLRDEMTTWFRGVLEERRLPWVEVAGSRTERLDVAMRELATRAAAAPLLRSGED